MELIYLDKREHENETWEWRYFRITGGDNAEGFREPIVTCLLDFPDFKDIAPPISTPGMVESASAYETINTLLKEQWDIDRERAILIGVRTKRSE